MSSWQKNLPIIFIIPKTIVFKKTIFLSRTKIFLLNISKNKHLRSNNRQTMKQNQRFTPLEKISTNLLFPTYTSIMTVTSLLTNCMGHVSVSSPLVSLLRSKLNIELRVNTPFENLWLLKSQESHHYSLHINYVS